MIRGNGGWTRRVAIGCLWLCAAGAAQADVTIENREVRLTFSDNGRARSLIYKPTGEECLASGEAPAFAAVRHRGYEPEKVTPASAVRREGDRLIISFVPLVSVATIRVVENAHYLAFVLERVDGRGGFFEKQAWESEFNEELHPFDELRFLQLPLRRRERFGAWMNVDWDDRLAINLLTIAPGTKVDAIEQRDARVLRASWWPEAADSAAVALIVSPPDQLLDAVDQTEADFGLPRGVRARRSPEAKLPYWEVRDPLTPANVEKIIHYARLGGLRLVQLYHGEFARSAGHFALREEFPRGVEDLRAAVQQLSDAGLLVGAHVHFNKTAIDDAYVTPRPDPRLNLRRHLTLSQPLSTSDTVVRVYENPRNITLDEGRRVLRFGDELISFQTYSTEAPYEFRGCGRGALGTAATVHSAGTIGGLLDIDNWPVWVRFNQQTDIQREVAQRLAKLCNDVGFRFIYFDGSEDTPAPWWYNVAHAQWQLYRELQPEPLFGEASNLAPFSWHMMSRSTAEDSPRAETMKALVRERRLPEVAERAKNFSCCDFGWVRLSPPSTGTDGMQPDILEYVISRAAGWDCPISLTGSLAELEAAPRIADNLEVVRRWEQARASGWLTEERRQALRGASPEHTLLIDEAGRFELDECETLAVGTGATSVRAYLVKREGKPWVVFWDARGRSRIFLRAQGEARVYLNLGQPLPLARSATGEIELECGERRYVEFPGMTAEAMVAMFQTARASPRLAHFK